MKVFAWHSIPIRRWDARKYASAVESLSCCLETPGKSSSVSDADKVLIAQTINCQILLETDHSKIHGTYY
jgi:hypothetical protein